MDACRSASWRQAPHAACFGSKRRGTGSINRTAKGTLRCHRPPDYRANTAFNVSISSALFAIEKIAGRLKTRRISMIFGARIMDSMPVAARELIRSPDCIGRLCHVRGNRACRSLPACLYFNTLGPSWPSQISSKIAYTWRM